jgi:acyl-CoA reductase-like NAD-dependent aldehyde dehydrogenase
LFYIFLIAGNAVVMKPSEETPLSCLFFGKLISEIEGFPKGLFNVVPGYGNVAGKALTEHMDVDKISFTGSTVIGK